MKVGHRVFLGEGYDEKPAWLGGGAGYFGTIEKFIPGQNDDLAAVVRLEQPAVTEGLRGSYAVLALRYQGATWSSSQETVHVELCDFIPADIRWQDRRQGTWVESHATVKEAT